MAENIITHLGLQSCECEHLAHLEETSLEHPCHRYMAEFHPKETERVHTVYGWYFMCEPCAAAIRKDSPDLLMGN